MSRTIRLKIISPDRNNIDENIISLTTMNFDGGVEIYANHTAMIMSTIPTVTSFVDESGNNKSIFTSSGIICIKNNEIKFCCDSINWPEEVDRQRAKASKERAEKRIHSNEDIDVDIERAKRSLARATARLKL